MKIIVFGDVCGDIKTIVNFCKKYESDFQCKIDLVLQVGDFTIPADGNIPVENETVQRFSDYISGKAGVAYPVVFVKGHSENYDLLESNKDNYIDKQRTIYFLHNGSVFNFKQVSIGGLGGNRSGTRDKDGNTTGDDKYFYRKLLKGNRRRHFTKVEIDKLINQDKNIDILLLHDSPLGLGKMKVPNFDEVGNPLPTGSKELTEVVKTVNPKFAFFGHYHNFSGIHKINDTVIIGLNSVKNKKGAAAILNIPDWEYRILNL